VLQFYLRHNFYNAIFKIKHKLYIALGSAPNASPIPQTIRFARLHMRLIRSSLDISYYCKVLISLFVHPCLPMRSFRITKFFFAFHHRSVHPFFIHNIRISLQWPVLHIKPSSIQLTHIILKRLVTPDEFHFPLRIDRLLPSIVLVSVRVSRDCRLNARHSMQIHSAIYRER